MKITELTKRNILFTVPENASDGYVHMGLIMGKKHNFIIDTGMGESNVRAMLEYIGSDSKPLIAINIIDNTAKEKEAIASLNPLCLRGLG